MKKVSRRDAMQKLGTTGAAAAALMAASAKAAAPAAQGKKHNMEPAVESTARAENHGARQLFAVVDPEGNLKRGENVVSSQRLGFGIYEVLFNRDVRRGAYLATAGGHGYAGVPLGATANVMGRATDPHGVLVYTTNMEGEPINTGFHLLVVCPEGFA